MQMQLPIYELERYRDVTDGVAVIARSISYFNQFEVLYDDQSASIILLKDSLVAIYSKILEYLAKAIKFYESNVISMQQPPFSIFAELRFLDYADMAPRIVRMAQSEFTSIIQDIDGRMKHVQLVAGLADKQGEANMYLGIALCF
jgi:hypothetical protein